MLFLDGEHRALDANLHGQDQHLVPGPRHLADLIRQAYKIAADDDLMSNHQLQRLTALASAWRKIRSGIVTNGLPLRRVKSALDGKIDTRSY